MTCASNVTTAILAIGKFSECWRTCRETMPPCNGALRPWLHGFNAAVHCNNNFSQSVFDCKISVVIAQDDKSPAVGAGHIHQNTFGKICSFQGGFEFIKAAYRLLAYFRDHIAGQEAAT